MDDNSICAKLDAMMSRQICLQLVQEKAVSTKYVFIFRKEETLLINIAKRNDCWKSVKDLRQICVLIPSRANRRYVINFA